MKRVPLRRKKPLARGTSKLTAGKPMRRKRAKPRRSSRKIDKAHLDFVRTLPCCVCGRRPPSEPHHETYGRGLSQKADDDRTIPVCRRCHDDAQDGRGPFKGWT